MFGILGRIILWDMLRFTLLALVCVSAFVMLGGGAIEALRTGISPLQVIELMPYLIPQTLPYTLPASLLFATTIVYGTMTANNEVTAAKAAGIHPFLFIKPAVAVSLAAVGFGVYAADRVIPYCHGKVGSILMREINGLLHSYLNEFRTIGDKDGTYTLHVHSVQNGRLKRPILTHKSSGEKEAMLVQAEDAFMNVVVEAGAEPKVVLRLREGFAGRGTNNNYFKDQVFDLPLPDVNALMNAEKVQALTFSEAAARAGKLKAKLDGVLLTRSATFQDATWCGEPEVLLLQATKDANGIKAQYTKIREIEAETHMRLSQASSSFGFVMLGTPLALLFRRRDFLQTFFICFLPIIAVYYPVTLLIFNIYKEDGLMLPAASVWIPSILLVLFSLPFIGRVVRY